MSENTPRPRGTDRGAGEGGRRPSYPASEAELFRTFFDDAPVGKSITAPDGRLIRVNRAFGDMLARSPEEMQAVCFADITHPDDLPESRECVRSLLAGERETWTMEKRYLARDGRAVWTLVTTKLVRDEAGAPAFFLTHVVDISDRKRAEEALRASEERHRVTTLSIGDAVVTTDAEGRVDLANPVAEALTGWTAEEARGRPIDEVFRIVNEETGAPVESPVARVLREGKVVGLANHTVLVDREGRGRHIADSGAPIRDERGEIAGVVLVFRDQTEERQHQREILRLSSVLRAIRDVNQLVARERDPLRLIEQSCEALVGARGYMGAMVVLSDADGRPTEWRHAGLDERFAELERGLRRGEWPRCRAAAHESAPGVAALDPRSACGPCPLREHHGRNLAAGLLHDGRDLGLLVVSLPGEIEPGAEEQGLIAEVAGDLAFALDAIDLERQRDRFARIVASSAEAMALVDRRLVFLEANPAYLRLVGWPEPSVAGRPVEEVVGERAFREPIAPGLARCLAGEAVRFESRRPGPGGEDVVVEALYTPCAGPDGGVEAVAVCLRDVTEGRRTEAALAAERDNLRAFLDSAPAAILVVDEREAVVAANPEAERLFGRLPDEAAGARRCGDLAGCTHCDEDPRGCGFGPSCPACEVNRAIKEALSYRVVRNREASLVVRGEGGAATRWFVLGAAPLVLREGCGAALALQDVTAAKEALEERERLRASLAQSDRLASMGTLAAGVAHEINNPLSYVLFNVESAVEDLPRLAERTRRCHEALMRHLGPEGLEEALGADHEDHGAAMEDVLGRLREAAGGAQRIKQIARGLGTFSRVERDEVGAVALQPVIEQALSMAFNQIKYRARVVKDYSPVPPVLASDGKLAQVFLNLFVNAAHAIDEGHVEANEIRVRTWAEGDSVLAEVSDTGKGIPPEDRDRVFEPFFTTKERGAGSGLGLSISKSIVTGFGGEVSLSSEVGAGSRFLVRLPRLPPGWRAGGPAPPAAAPGSAAVRGRVLVVADEEGIRAAIARMLRRDHEVVSAASGEEARELLEGDRRFDLILCDLMMPRVSGMELHAWLAGMDAALAEQVVFITGGAFTPGASDYLARVGNLRVEKPFDAIAFKKLVDELVLAARSKRRG